tara:strand:- start:4565 stop:6724 length:2160 start_codon:yes stop_codon:yes gene_type:complete
MVDSIFAKGGPLAQAAGASLMGRNKRKRRQTREALFLAAFLESLNVGKQEQKDLRDTELSSLMENLDLNRKADEYTFNNVLKPILTTEKHYNEAGSKGQLLMDENGQAILTEDGRLQFKKAEDGTVLRGGGNSWFLNHPDNRNNAVNTFYNTEQGKEIENSGGLSYLTREGRAQVDARIQEIADNLELNHLNEINNPLFSEKKVTNPIDFYRHNTHNKFVAERAGITEDPTRASVGGWMLGKVSKYGDETNTELEAAIIKARKDSADVDKYVEQLRQPDQAPPSMEEIKGLFQFQIDRDKEWNAAIDDTATEIETGEGVYTSDLTLKVYSLNESDPFAFEKATDDDGKVIKPSIEVTPFAKTGLALFGGDSVSDQWGLNGTVQVRDVIQQQDGSYQLAPFNAENQQQETPSLELAKMIMLGMSAMEREDILPRLQGGSKEQQLLQQRILRGTGYDVKVLNVLAQKGYIQKSGNNLVLLRKNPSSIRNSDDLFDKSFSSIQLNQLDQAPLLSEELDNFKTNQINTIVDTGIGKDLLPLYESTNPKDMATVEVMYIINPPFEAEGKNVKVTKLDGTESLLALGMLPQGQANKIYENFKRQFGRSMELEKILEEKYPTPPPPPPPTPTTPEKQVSLDSTDLRKIGTQGTGTGGAELFAALGRGYQSQLARQQKERLQAYANTGKTSMFLKEALESVGLKPDATRQEVREYLGTSNKSLLAQQ